MHSSATLSHASDTRQPSSGLDSARRLLHFGFLQAFQAWPSWDRVRAEVTDPLVGMIDHRRGLWNGLWTTTRSCTYYTGWAGKCRHKCNGLGANANARVSKQMQMKWSRSMQANTVSAPNKARQTSPLFIWMQMHNRKNAFFAKAHMGSKLGANNCTA